MCDRKYIVFKKILKFQIKCLLFEIKKFLLIIINIQYFLMFLFFLLVDEKNWCMNVLVRCNYFDVSKCVNKYVE